MHIYTNAAASAPWLHTYQTTNTSFHWDYRDVLHTFLPLSMSKYVGKPYFSLAGFPSWMLNGKMKRIEKHDARRRALITIKSAPSPRLSAISRTFLHSFPRMYSQRWKREQQGRRPLWHAVQEGKNECSWHTASKRMAPNIQDGVARFRWNDSSGRKKYFSSLNKTKNLKKKWRWYIYIYGYICMNIGKKKN